MEEESKDFIVEDDTEVFTNKNFVNQRVISCVDKILRNKKFPRRFIGFPKYPNPIWKNHSFRIASSNSSKQYRKEIPDSEMVIIDHLFKGKVVETFGVDVIPSESDPKSKYKFCYMDSREDCPNIKFLTRFNPGWWDVNSKFMDWEWLISHMEAMAAVNYR